jgi:hypothetical protein
MSTARRATGFSSEHERGVRSGAVRIGKARRPTRLYLLHFIRDDHSHLLDEVDDVRWHFLRQRNAFTARTHDCRSTLLSSRDSSRLDAAATQFDAALFGVNETPRRTWSKPAVRTVVKLSVVGRLIAAKVSVIMTSLFGSAPWSPFPLTVEVTPQIVTVPSSFTWPVMLRSEIPGLSLSSGTPGSHQFRSP